MSRQLPLWEDRRGDPAYVDEIRKLCLKSFKTFVKSVFLFHYKQKFIWSEHHDEITAWLMGVWLGKDVGKKRNIIINIPPRYSKTEMICLFAAWAYAHNPRCEFMHLSYSSTLAEKNSDRIKGVVKSRFYSDLFGVFVDPKKDSVSEWRTLDGGIFYATATGGQVTGFGAGSANEMQDGKYTFSGCLLIDDPLKPDDANTVRREQINERWHGTIKSRRNNPETTPTICIMQRIHEGDFTSELQADEGEEFQTLSLCALRDDGSALWPKKHNVKQLEDMQSRNLYVFSAQYQQNPTPAGGSVFKKAWWQYYVRLPETLDEVIITADTAQKAKEHNDYSVFQCWARSNNKIYLIDQVRGKWEAPQLKDIAISFIDKIKATYRLRAIHIEDKSSGTGLIQSICGITPIIPIQRNIDKVTRAYDAAPYIQSGQVHLPDGSAFTELFVQEATSFSATMAHLHDDQIDPMMDAVDVLLDKAPPAPFFGRPW